MRDERFCSCCGQEIIKDCAIRVGHLVIDTRLRLTTWKGTRIHFTEQEGGVIEYLAGQADRVAPKWALHQNCFDEDETDRKIVDVIICKIRAKFRTVDPDFDAIQTVWGQGYRWESGGVEAAPEMSREEAVAARLAAAGAAR